MSQQQNTNERFPPPAGQANDNTPKPSRVRDAIEKAASEREAEAEGERQSRLKLLRLGYGPDQIDMMSDNYKAGVLSYEAAKAMRERKERPKFKPTPFADPDPASLPPRDWLYGKHYIRKYVVADIAPTGTIKSTNALVEAIAMASGADLLVVGDAQMPPRPLKVWYWSGEDPKEEIDRRLAAAVKLYTDERDDVLARALLTVEQRALLKRNLFTDTGRNVPIKIAVEDKGTFKIAEPVIDELVRVVQAYGLDVLIIDPFVDSHGVGENDNNRIEAVVAAWRTVAERAGCCICLVHHTRKASRGGSKENDADDARGAGAFGAAVRSLRVFNVMDADEAAELGVTVDQRWRYVRVSNGKPNMARRDLMTTWLYIESVKLGNARPAGEGETRGRPEDEVGVVVPWQPTVKSDIQTADDRETILGAVLKLLDAGKRITRSQGGDYTVKALVPYLRRENKVKVTVAEIKDVLDAACEDRRNSSGADAVLYYMDDAKRGKAGYRRVSQ
jgi:hypothetical protein